MHPTEEEERIAEVQQKQPIYSRDYIHKIHNYTNMNMQFIDHTCKR